MPFGFIERFIKFWAPKINGIHAVYMWFGRIERFAKKMPMILAKNNGHKYRESPYMPKLPENRTLEGNNNGQKIKKVAYRPKVLRSNRFQARSSDLLPN